MTRSILKKLNCSLHAAGSFLSRLAWSGGPSWCTCTVAVSCFALALVCSPATPPPYADGVASVPSGSSSSSSCCAHSSALVDGVTVAGIPPYDRSEWLPSWSDEDGDGLDTRAEVLLEESLSDVSYSANKRRVVAGRWVCPYTGVVYDSSSYLDVEHVVPLREAHASGGWAWLPSKKHRYANYMGMRSHLQAVGSSINRSKGDKRPDQWLPPYRQYRCAYVRDWATVKASWGLVMVPSEKAFVDSMLTACSR